MKIIKNFFLSLFFLNITVVQSDECTSEYFSQDDKRCEWEAIAKRYCEGQINDAFPFEQMEKSLESAFDSRSIKTISSRLRHLFQNRIFLQLEDVSAQLRSSENFNLGSPFHFSPSSGCLQESNDVNISSDLFDIDSNYEDWHLELLNNSNSNGSFNIDQYSIKHGHLTFLGMRHLLYSNNESNHINEIFQALGDQIEKEKPAIMVLEPIEPFDLGSYSPCSKSIALAMMAPDEVIRLGNEGDFSAWWAIAKGIPFVSGEPSQEQILSALNTEYADRNISTEDYQMFVLFRCMVSQTETNNLQEKLNRCQSNPRYIMKNLSEVSNWYKLKNGEDITSQDDLLAQIVPNRNSAQTNLIAATISEIRNSRLRKIIYDNLELRDRVMAVYGIGHLLQNRRAFSAHEFAE